MSLDFQPVFRTLTGLGEAAVTELAGGASARRYFRVRGGGHRFVVMVLASEPIRSEEATSGADPDELPFLTMQRLLSGAGVSVPAIHHVDEERGHLWLDDLGDTVLLDVLAQGDRRARYQEALDVLVAFQRATAEPPPDPPICFQRRFEPALLRWELQHYVEWRLEVDLGRAALPAKLSEAFDDLVSRVTALPHRVCHRDFQSTNLMVTERGLVLIDFQDALVGPYVYDLVALLRDSYVVLSASEVDALLGDYTGRRPDLDREATRRAFHLQTVQRKLKDAGRFVYIDRVKGDPRYLKYVVPSLGYVRDALALLPELQGLAALLAELDPALRP